MTDDEAGSPVSTAAAFLINAIARTEMAELELPHIVICTDVATNTSTYHGPYASALDAVTAVQAEIEALKPAAGSEPEDEVRFAIAPLRAAAEQPTPGTPAPDTPGPGELAGEVSGIA
jgi:hypothetical protein